MDHAVLCVQYLFPLFVDVRVRLTAVEDDQDVLGCFCHAGLDGGNKAWLELFGDWQLVHIEDPEECQSGPDAVDRVQRYERYRR